MPFPQLGKTAEDFSLPSNGAMNLVMSSSLILSSEHCTSGFCSSLYQGLFAADISQLIAVLLGSNSLSLSSSSPFTQVVSKVIFLYCFLSLFSPNSYFLQMPPLFQIILGMKLSLKTVPLCVSVFDAP